MKVRSKNRFEVSGHSGDRRHMSNRRFESPRSTDGFDRGRVRSNGGVSHARMKNDAATGSIELRASTEAELRKAALALLREEGAAALSSTPSSGATTGASLHVEDTAAALESRAQRTASLSALAGQTLVSVLQKSFHPTQHVGYDHARKEMFSRLDNHNGHVRCVYTGREIVTHGIPNAEGSTRMNTEHTFPKSWLKGTSRPLSDLHHLFPTDTQTNAMRSSYPFGEVVHVEWTAPGGEAKLGKDASGQTVFEPPDSHKGNVARAMFYISSVYGLKLTQRQQEVLRSWSKLDPVDQAERQRNEEIAKIQGNVNPFVDSPELIDRVAQA